MLNKQLTKEQAIPKIKHYCSYQERSHYEVKEKLFSYGLFKKTVEEIIALLIEEDHLNEERFAKSYARGKFKINHWGKIKIEQGLKQRQVSTYNIRIAMKQIDEESYHQTLNKLAQQKWDHLKGEQYLRRQAKTTAYLLQKGFESSLVYAAVKALQEESKKRL